MRDDGTGMAPFGQQLQVSRMHASAGTGNAMTGKCGLCGSEYEIQRRKVRYDERADGPRVYYFFRAKCRQCGGRSEWQRTAEGAAEKVESREQIIKASKKWAIVCPFYKGNAEWTITCECCAEGAATVTTRYTCEREKFRKLAMHCKGEWEECWISKGNSG